MHNIVTPRCLMITAIAVFLTNAGTAQEKGIAPRVLEQAWSLEGNWTGVASTKNGGIYAIGPTGKCIEVDFAGKQQREIKIAEGITSLRIANVRGAAGKVLLAFRGWGHELRAYDLSGKQLWSYTATDAINDVWAGDLNGDGSDEVIIGYNGYTGLHVLDSVGKLLWKATAQNVWHVCAGNVLGEGMAQVLTTSAEWKVHVFDSSGKRIKDLDAGCVANMVRVGKLFEKDKAATIIVAGYALDPNNPSDILTAISGQGDKKWAMELPRGRSGIVSAQLAPGKPWLAAGRLGGQVYVVDIEKGQIIASAQVQGKASEVGWVVGKEVGTPLLLLATGSKLTAFRFVTVK